MESGDDYMTNMYYNMQIPKEQNINYDFQDNNEELEIQDNSNNLLEKMETTLNTFLNNLKKDEIIKIIINRVNKISQKIIIYNKKV